MALRPPLWIVLPVRGEASGKSRLATTLDPIERARLNRALLHRTLSVIERWQGNNAHCVVVSPCARSLHRARTRGAIALPEPRPARGLNRAAALGVAFARQRGARRVLVLPCDLALLRAASLCRMALRARAGARAAIASDRAGCGTNVFLLPAAARFEFAYGADSFARHLRAIGARGWTVTVCREPDLRFDLDAPADLRAFAAMHARVG